jgi:hypothetical protein
LKVAVPRFLAPWRDTRPQAARPVASRGSPRQASRSASADMIACKKLIQQRPPYSGHEIEACVELFGRADFEVGPIGNTLLGGELAGAVNGRGEVVDADEPCSPPTLRKPRISSAPAEPETAHPAAGSSEFWGSGMWPRWVASQNCRPMTSRYVDVAVNPTSSQAGCPCATWVTTHTSKMLDPTDGRCRPPQTRISPRVPGIRCRANQDRARPANRRQPAVVSVSCAQAGTTHRAGASGASGDRVRRLANPGTRPVGRSP